MTLGRYYREKTNGAIWKATATEYLYSAALGDEATFITLKNEAGDTIRLMLGDLEWNDFQEIRIN